MVRFVVDPMEDPRVATAEGVQECARQLERIADELERGEETVLPDGGRDRDPTSPEARLEAATKQLRLARERLQEEGEAPHEQQELYRLVRVQAVTDALAATDAALEIVRFEQAAMEAQR